MSKLPEFVERLLREHFTKDDWAPGAPDVSLEDRENALAFLRAVLNESQRYDRYQDTPFMALLAWAESDEDTPCPICTRDPRLCSEHRR